MSFAATCDTLIFIYRKSVNTNDLAFIPLRDILESPELAVKMERLGKRSVFLDLNGFPGSQVDKLA